MRYLFFLFALISTLHADKIVWQGEVNSNGTPTPVIKLELGKTYQFKTEGTINLGKWWQDGKPLIEDANFEYNENVKPQPLATLKNSMNIPIGSDKYNADHIYFSTPFVAAQNAVHFWIYDTNYDDNSGSLKVQISQITDK